MTVNHGERTDQAVVALSQAPAGMELAELAASMAAPLTSAQRAIASLVRDRFVVGQTGRRLRFALDPGHPAAPERVQLALRILPVEQATETVLRANPVVEFAGVDDEGYVVVLSPFCEAADVLRLQATLDRIREGRPHPRPVAMLERAEAREMARHDPERRRRGLGLRVIVGSAPRAFPDPDRSRPADALALRRLHPSLGRIPRAEIDALAERLGIARISVFGSAVRSDFRPDSDVDVLLEPEPGTPARLSALLAVEQMLERAFDRDVDVSTPGSLDPTILDRARREAVVLHG